MTGNIGGIASYQQTKQVWNAAKTSAADKNMKPEEAASGGGIKDMKISEWKPISNAGSLVPFNKEGYGTVIGNAELSDGAKNYYDKLKSKFHGMEFILVSKDMKSQVASNALAYGNAHKPVVLIDEEKLERMATDEAFRKKYEGIIAMSQNKLQAAKNSLASSGANVKNFGMSVDSDGRASFFATVEKANTAQTKALEKKQAEKKAAKAKEKKQAEKKAQEARIEKRREENRAEKAELAEKAEQIGKEESLEAASMEAPEEREYLEFKANSMESLINMVTKYAFENSMKNVMTEEEAKVGQNFDFKG